MTETPPTTSDAPAPSEPGGGAEVPPGPLERLDRGIYAAEQALVVGSLFVMTLNYVLTVLSSNMSQRYNKFDQLLVRFWGYPDTQSAPQAVLDSIGGLWSPLVLGLITFGLVLAALRTRERAHLKPGESPPPIMWRRKLVVAALVTGCLYGLVKLIEVVPSLYMATLALAGLVGATVYYGRGRNIPVQIGAAIAGGVFVTLYYISISDPYAQNAGFGAVMLIYVGFLGASMATKDERHIKVDAIRKSLKGPGFHLYNAVSGVVTALFTAFLFAMAINYLLEFVSKPDVQHTGSQLPSFVVALPIVVAFGLMMARFGARIVRSVKAWRRGEPAPAPAVELH